MQLIPQPAPQQDLLLLLLKESYPMALGESKHVNNFFIYEPSSQSFLHSKTKTCTLAEEESDLVREPEIVTDGLPTAHWTKTSAVLTHVNYKGCIKFYI